MPAPSVAPIGEDALFPGTSFDAVVVLALDPKATGVAACDEAAAPYAAGDATFGSKPTFLVGEGGVRYVIAPVGSIDEVRGAVLAAQRSSCRIRSSRADPCSPLPRAAPTGHQRCSLGL